MSQIQPNNGLTKKERTSNNGDDFYSQSFYAEVCHASARFWSNNQISHFDNGVPVRTSIPRQKPISMGWNDWKRTSDTPTVVRG